MEAEKLLEAIGNQDDALILELVNNGSDLNVESGNGWTPLMLAILKNSMPTVKLLLENGADPNRITLSEENPCRSAMKVAIVNGRVEMVKLLLQYHADIQSRDCFGQTVLEFAQKLVSRPFHQEDVRSIIVLLEQHKAN